MHQGAVEKCKHEGKDCKLQRGLILLDDCMGANTKLIYKPAFVNAFVTCRHFAVDIWMTAQYFTGLPPVVRSLINYSFIFRSQGLQQMKGLFEFAGGMCYNGFKEFEKIMNEYTKEEYACCVYNANSREYCDSYCSFKADIPPEFKLAYRLPFTLPKAKDTDQFA